MYGVTPLYPSVFYIFGMFFYIDELWVKLDLRLIDLCSNKVC